MKDHTMVRGVALAALLTLLVGGCTTTKPPDLTQPDLPSRTEINCDTSPTPRHHRFCRTVTLSGQPYRYVVLPATGGDVGTDQLPAIIVDRGGPGSSALAGTVAATDPDLPSDAASTHVIVLEEPWVTSELPDGCAVALSGFYRAVRAGTAPQAAATDVAERCALGERPSRYGLDGLTYSALVQRAVADAGAVPVGFLGHSFASVRRSYLEPRYTDWTVVGRPFPLGTTGGQLIASRIRAMSPAAELVITGSASSVEVQGFDAASARVAAASQGLRQISAEDVVRLSDGLWQRFGSDSISPSLLAYWDEVCRVAGGWPDAYYDGTSGDVSGLLSSLHAPCRTRVFNDQGPRVSTPAGPVADGCVTVGVSDTVTPASAIRQALSGVYALSVVSAVPAHSSRDGVRDCLNRVMLR